MDGQTVNRELLILTLQVAVPLIVADLATLEDDERRRKIAVHNYRDKAIDAISSHGDDLLYGGRYCASSFSRLAQGIAALSHCPGGVSVFGINWCATHHPMGRISDFQYCQECRDDEPSPASRIPKARIVEDVPLPEVTT